MGVLLEDQLPGVMQDGLNTNKPATFGGGINVTGGTTGSILTLVSADLTAVDTTAVHTVGTKGRDAAQNEYVYLKGVANVVAGSWVTYDELFVTALLVPDAVGIVAIAMAATVANRWGWFQIFGAGQGVIANTVSGDLPAYIGAVSGSVDDLLVTGDMIHGAIIRETGTVTGSTVDVQLNYPYVTNSVV